MGMDSGLVRGNLALWGTIALGVTIAFYSYLKPRKEKDQGLNPLEEEDQGLNQLNDDVLGNILSRLSLKEASRTSVLSRRWRKLLSSGLSFQCLRTLGISHIRVADADKQRFWIQKKLLRFLIQKRKQRFFRAIDQRLKVYSGSSQTLTGFSVSCCFLNEQESPVARWMEILSKLHVKVLSLRHSCSVIDKPELASWFSFKLLDGLTELFFLELSSCNVETSFVRECNSLKELGLWRVPLRGQELSDILLSCPNLVGLKMCDCELPQNLRFSGTMLKELVLYCCNDVQKLEISNANLVTIKICLPIDVEILLSTVPKLETLHLVTHRMNYSLKDFPRDLLQLKELVIQTNVQVPLLPPSFQVFGNVRILYLLTRGCNQASEEVDLWSFASVLSACPKLVKFYLTVGKVSGCEEKSMVKWPTLQHKHLKEMEFSGFCGTRYELEFAKFVWRSTQVLESLELSSSWRRFNGAHFWLEDVGAQHFDAQLVREELKGQQALSESANLVVNP